MAGIDSLTCLTSAGPILGEKKEKVKKEVKYINPKENVSPVFKVKKVNVLDFVLWKLILKGIYIKVHYIYFWLMK